MVRLVFIAILLMTTNCFIAQNSPEYMGKGLVQIQPTVSPGYMFAPKVSTVYFRANAEYYITNKASLKTDAYLFVGTNSDEEVLQANHSMFLGAFYHKLKGNTDFYVGLQPGVAYTKSTKSETNIYEPVLKISPLASGTLGINYYLNKLIHFYCQMQYVYGNHIPKYYKQVSLSELRFSIGVGLNYNFFMNKDK